MEHDDRKGAGILSPFAIHLVGGKDARLPPDFEIGRVAADKVHSRNYRIGIRLHYATVRFRRVDRGSPGAVPNAPYTPRGAL